MPIKILKIVIAGPYGAGKTTFVKTISEVLPIETDVPLTKTNLMVRGALLWLLIMVG